MQTAHIVEQFWLHIVCYRVQAVDKHCDPNNRVLQNLCGLGMGIGMKRGGSGRRWALSSFCFVLLSFFLFCWSQRGESQREQSGNVLARTDYVGTDHPNRRDEYYLVVDSNLSLSIRLLCTGYTR